MSHYAFCVYKNGQLNQPKYGGTVSALSMDDAVKSVIKTCHLKIHTSVNYFQMQKTYTFTSDGEKVGVLIYANPEDYEGLGE